MRTGNMRAAWSPAFAHKNVQPFMCVCGQVQALYVMCTILAPGLWIVPCTQGKSCSIVDISKLLACTILLSLPL